MVKKISRFFIFASVFFWLTSAIRSIIDLEVGDLAFFALLLGIGLFIIDEIVKNEG